MSLPLCRRITAVIALGALIVPASVSRAGDEYFPPTLLLTPVVTHPDGAYNTGGYYSEADITGNRLTLRRGGGRTYWNMQLLGFDGGGDLGPCLWQGRIDANSFLGASADVGDLVPASAPCDVDLDCENRFGEASVACLDGVCEFGFVNTARSDWMFADAPGETFGACGLISPTGPLCFGVMSPRSRYFVDGSQTFYGATLVLDVPSDAKGFYTISWIPSDTFINACCFDPLCGLTIPASRLHGELYVETGACCLDLRSGGCEDGVTANECDALRTSEGRFHPNRTCGNTQCLVTGACCEGEPFEPAIATTCEVTHFDECNCETCVWSSEQTCDDVDCRAEIVGLPAISGWSLAILTLAMCVALTVKFSRRFFSPPCQGCARGGH